MSIESRRVILRCAAQLKRIIVHMRMGSESAVLRIAAPYLAPWSQDSVPSAGLPELVKGQSLEGTHNILYT